MNRKILITGATSGFGKAIAGIFAKHGDDCIITGRRADRLEEICMDLENKYNVAVYPLCFDVQDRDAVNIAIESLPDEWKNIDILVNNAGLALGRDHFDQAEMEDWETMINTNVKGLLYVSKAVIPIMIGRKKGHIINIGSTAAKEVYEKGNIYCATKAAVDSISQSMRIDLLQHGIKVTAIHPGAAETEFSLVRFKGDSETAKSVYTGIDPLVGEDVADVVYYCTTLPPHVCINDLVMTSTAQANSFYFHRK
jgi:3-hydroxy acid dehydrogenase / malonic semialdehyde reductase